MDRETARALNAINRAFYRERASAFSASREAPWPGFSRLLSIARAEFAGRAWRVLDVGCGNGRFATFLASRADGARPAPADAPAPPFRLARYVGLDASIPLAREALERARGVPSAEIRLADFVEEPPADAIPDEPFDLVACFGVLHHVPGAQRRRALLETLATRLVPGGLLAVTAWQLAAFERFRARTLAWDAWNRIAARPVDVAELEPGDHLLRWGDAAEGAPVRYVHFADEEETGRLLAGTGLERVACFRSDGHSGNLNRYFILRRGA